MEAAHKRIVSGEPFPDVAREVSEDAASAEQGGLYPDSMSGTVPPIIEELMFTLPLGEVSEPIQSEMGWHLMIVYKRYNPGMYTFEELREQFREPLIDKQVQAIIAEKVATLRKILRIEIDEAAVAAIPLHEEH
jgi:parvulin-like peptidyl-prolyl isomerase